MPASSKVIGIDLGTTNSCMAMILQGEIVVLPNAERARTTPSVVAFHADGTWEAGAPARQQAVLNHEATVFSIKRFMGQKMDSLAVAVDQKLVPYTLEPAENGDVRVKIGEKLWSPQEISARVLAKMKDDAEAFLGETVTQAVITVPAHFNDSQRQATKDAGKIAGLEVLRIINEPTAAAMACGLDKRKNLKVAVYDLGGGTFDISILELGNGVFEVKATNGDTHLGGDDFDQAIIRLLLDYFNETEGVDLRKNKLALQRFKEAAEKAKIELSTSLQTEINLPFIYADAERGPRHLVYSLTREMLDQTCKLLVELTLPPCEKALQEAKLSKSQVDEVVLVGGMTRMPAVVDAVTKFFGKPPFLGVNPDETVALGAAIEGGVLKGTIRDKLLLDVTPMSLGVRVGGGYFSKVIERNTTIPHRQTQTYTTANDKQTSVRISVYQGEAALVSENAFLGDFELVNIKKADKGEPQIEVTFDIDANGILKVSGRDKETKQVQQIKVEPNSGLSQQELERMARESEALAKKKRAASSLSQYLMTCKMLVEEAVKEIRQGALATPEEKNGFYKTIQALEKMPAPDLDSAKEKLKDLNEFLMLVRQKNNPNLAAAPAPVNPPEV